MSKSLFFMFNQQREQNRTPQFIGGPQSQPQAIIICRISTTCETLVGYIYSVQNSQKNGDSLNITRLQKMKIRANEILESSIYYDASKFVVIKFLLLLSIYQGIFGSYIHSQQLAKLLEANEWTWAVTTLRYKDITEILMLFQSVIKIEEESIEAINNYREYFGLSTIQTVQTE